MSLAEQAAVVIPADRVARRRPRWGFARRFVRHAGAMIGLVLLVILSLSAIFADRISLFDPTRPDFRSRLQPPSLTHPFGTDELGRDVFTRVLHGGRISLRVGLISVAIGAVAGTVIGLISGFYRGWVDELIMRLMDMLMALPGILLSLTIVFALGPSLFNVMIAVGVASIPEYARVVRGSVLSAREHVYVEAARASGVSDTGVMFRHILPNVFAPIIIIATLGLAGAILSVAALSFLGLGAAPPTPEWGVIIADGRSRLRTEWWISTFPGLVIALTVLAINLLGDGLRDLLDPRLRNR